MCTHMKSFYPKLSIYAAILSAACCFADDGIIVSAYCKSKQVGDQVGMVQRGSIVKYALSGSSTGSPETIFDYDQGGLAHYPVVNVNGTKIAFWRWGVSQVRSGDQLTWVQRPGPLPNPNWLPDTNYLSVMNIDGSDVRNLLIVDPPCISSGEELVSALAWPCGDWIYYEKPTNSWEIWRVHCENPLLNELVVKFVRGDEGSESSTPYFRRFSLSIDARFAGGQLSNYTNTSFFNFPPPGGDVRHPDAHLCGTGGCNTAMSASGKHIAHYLYGNHETTYFQTYDGISQSGNGSQNVQGGSERIRWSCNSDRWLSQCYSSGLSDDGYQNWANQVVRNVVDRFSIYPHNNSNGWNNCAGDIWISGGPGDAYQEQDGSWTHVDPVVPRDQTAPSTPTGLSVQAHGSHVATLSWNASTDGESGVFCYIVYRDGTQTGTTAATTYTDSGLSEGTTYTYEVSAINRGNTESPKASVSHSTSTDTQGANIIAVDAACGSTTLQVFFDEPLDNTTAETAANYTIPGVSVSGAVVSADGANVTLTTSEMTAGTDYTLTVQNVMDKAGSPNASSATAPFTYEGMAHGLVYETYSASCGYDDVPALSGTPVATGVVSNLDLSVRGNPCAMRFKGYLRIPETGSYHFKFSLYYSGNVTLDGAKVIDLGGNWAGSANVATLQLTAGLHPLQIDMATPWGTMWALGWYSGPDGMMHRISDDMLFHAAGGGAVNGSHRARMESGKAADFSLHQTPGHLNVRMSTPGRHQVALIAPDGAVVRVVRGTAPAVHTLPIGDIAGGVYFVQVTSEGRTAVRTMLLK